jgi:hypothetical protein
MYRNLAQPWVVFAFDETDGTVVTGDAANIDAKVSKDGATASALADLAPVELESGYYQFDLTAGETNAHMLTLIPVSATTNVQVVGVPGTVFTFEHVICGLCTTAGAADTVETTLQTTHSLSTANALNGRILIFDADTATAALRQQAGEITGYDGAGTLTFASGAFTVAHGATDTFKIY